MTSKQKKQKIKKLIQDIEKDVRKGRVESFISLEGLKKWAQDVQSKTSESKP